jgi:hypothetical protein
MFFDPMYLLFAAPALIVMLYAQWRVSSTYKKYSKVTNMQKKTGAEIALFLLRANGLSNVRIQCQFAGETNANELWVGYKNRDQWRKRRSLSRCLNLRCGSSSGCI